MQCTAFHTNAVHCVPMWNAVDGVPCERGALRFYGTRRAAFQRNAARCVPTERIAIRSHGTDCNPFQWERGAMRSIRTRCTAFPQNVVHHVPCTERGPPRYWYTPGSPTNAPHSAQHNTCNQTRRPTWTLYTGPHPTTHQNQVVGTIICM